MTGTLLASIGTAALAGLLFGVDTAVIAGVTDDLVRVYALDPRALGITVSAALWGTLVGALAAGRPGDAYGSRRVLGVLGGFYLLAGIGCAVAPGWELFLLARFVCGLAIGGSSVLAPVYIAEIAPPARRGALVALFQLAIVTGILAAYLSNWAVAAAIGGPEAWRWKLGITAVPALIFLLLLTRIPDSPRWLLLRGRAAEARAAFGRIGLAPAAAEIEVRTLSVALADAPKQERLSWRRHRKPIVLAVLLAAFNQLAGINAVLYYLNDIFRQAGSISPDAQAVAIGAANLLFTLVGAALIDRLGRRTLLVAGAVGMTACLLLAAAALGRLVPAWLLLPALVGYIACFAPSQGAVIWVYLSEIFPSPVRARGAGLGASTHWLMNALIVAVFPILIARSAATPFLLFAACMAVQAVVVLLFFPETKRTALDGIPALEGWS